MDAWEVVWWLLILYTTFIRMKYVWLGNKVRRTRSCKDVSTKAILHTHVEYWIMFMHNLNIADVKDQVFWLFGIFTTAFTVIILWRHREEGNDNVIQWLYKGFLGKLKDEGGLIW